MSSSCDNASSNLAPKQDSKSKSGDLTGTIAKHYNDLQETGLEARKDSRIFYLRNFNNWVKSVLISDFIDELRKEDRSRKIKALDIGCGKGGDIRKWKYGRVAKVVFSDIASTSIEQCQARYREMVGNDSRGRYPQNTFGAEFHAADCTKERLKDIYQEKDISFDLASCQFAFHYAFESLPQTEMMLRNACECLKPGGFFIGTTPDSLELVKRLRASADMSFGNDVYRVTFLGDSKDDLPLFGCKYDFHLEGVVDCPEFLVYFPLLEKLAEEFDMKLVYKKSFSEFFKEKYAVRQHRELLERMKALESYPPPPSAKAASDTPESYAHVKDKLAELSQQNPDQPARVATLTREEWEATSLYLAFAFQKRSRRQQEASSPKLGSSEKPAVNSQTSEGPPHAKSAKLE